MELITLALYKIINTDELFCIDKINSDKIYVHFVNKNIIDTRLECDKFILREDYNKISYDLTELTQLIDYMYTHYITLEDFNSLDIMYIGKIQNKRLETYLTSDLRDIKQQYEPPIPPIKVVKCK